MKCLVVTSQYWHSRHSFLVEYNEDTFQQKAIECVKELETYKRDPSRNRDFCLGDLDDRWYRKGRSRCNVNDEGDIYFNVCGSLNSAIYEIKQYSEQSRRESRGYIRKAVIESISDHHSLDVVKGIVSKYFTLIRAKE